MRIICETLVHNLSEVNVWAAWVLVLYMLSDTRLRRLVRTSSVTDMDVATAIMMILFGRCEVTRRARMEASASADKKPGTKRKVDDDDDPEEMELADYDDGGELFVPTAAPGRARESARNVEVLAEEAAHRGGHRGRRVQSVRNNRPVVGGRAAVKWTSIFRTLSRSPLEAVAAAVETLAEQSAGAATRRRRRRRRRQRRRRSSRRLPSPKGPLPLPTTSCSSRSPRKMPFARRRPPQA